MRSFVTQNMVQRFKIVNRIVDALVTKLRLQEPQSGDIYWLFVKCQFIMKRNLNDPSQ